MKKFLVLVSMLICEAAQAAGWYDVGNVTRVHSGHGDGVLYFSTQIQISNAAYSTNVGYTYNNADSNSKAMYSLLLSAYITKSPVSIYVTDVCFSNRPQVNAVQFKDPGVAY